MAYFIDRRLNGKNKSMVNRQRFLRRYKSQIKQSIAEAINKRSVTDVDSGESVSIPGGDIIGSVLGGFVGGGQGDLDLTGPSAAKEDAAARCQGGGRLDA